MFVRLNVILWFQSPVSSSFSRHHTSLPTLQYHFSRRLQGLPSNYRHSWPQTLPRSPLFMHIVWELRGWGGSLHFYQPGKFELTLSEWVLVAQQCPILCYSMDCSPPGSSVHGIFQARILELFAISFSKGSSLPGDQIQGRPNPGLLHCRQILYHLSHQGSPSLVKGRENISEELNWFKIWFTKESKKKKKNQDLK